MIKMLANFCTENVYNNYFSDKDQGRVKVKVRVKEKRAPVECEWCTSMFVLSTVYY